MSYLEEYLDKELQLNKWQFEVEKNVVNLIKTQPNQRIIIGNTVYSVMKWGDIEVPTYAYLADIHTEGNPYYPIWDREETSEFGWYNFEECCRIFDVITKTIQNK